MYIRIIPAILLWALFNCACAQDGNGKYDGLYDRPTHYPDWVQPTNWSDNMSYFVCVHMEGLTQRMENYEVAVFDQDNQLRHCSRSIAADNQVCTLTIMGAAGDSFHFEVVYGDFQEPTVAQAAESCSFVVNDVVGSISEPFWLTVPNTGGDGIEAAPAAESQHTYYTLYGQPMPLTTGERPSTSGLYVTDGKCIQIR